MGHIELRLTLQPYQRLSMVKNSLLGQTMIIGELKLEKLRTISHKYDDGGSFKELYPIVKAESWLKSNQNWYYQKQGQLVQNDWVKDKGLGTL